MNSVVQLEEEENRIRDAYARRKQAGADSRYTFFSPANLAIIQEREQRTLRALRRAGITTLSDLSLLEIGSGRGFWLRQFIHWGMPPSQVAGVELLPDHAQQSREVVPSTVLVHTGSAAALPFPDRSFDLVLQSTVFSSILQADVRMNVAREMMRIVRPDGLILWYDFHVDNPRNHDVRGIRKREIRQLFSGWRIDLQRITLAPPIARAVVPIHRALYSLLAAPRFLNTHYLAIITK